MQENTSGWHVCKKSLSTARNRLRDVNWQLASPFCRLTFLMMPMLVLKLFLLRVVSPSPKYSSKVKELHEKTFDTKKSWINAMKQQICNKKIKLKLTIIKSEINIPLQLI